MKRQERTSEQQAAHDAAVAVCNTAIIKIIAYTDVADTQARRAIRAIEKDEVLYAALRKNVVKTEKALDRVQSAIRWYTEERGDWETMKTFFDEWEKDTRAALTMLMVAYKQAMDDHHEAWSLAFAESAVAAILIKVAVAVRSKLGREVVKYNRDVLRSSMVTISLVGVERLWMEVVNTMMVGFDINADARVLVAQQEVLRVFSDNDIFNGAMLRATEIMDEYRQSH